MKSSNSTRAASIRASDVRSALSTYSLALEKYGVQSMKLVSIFRSLSARW